MAALVTSGSAELFRIVVYGDSNTYGWIPNLDPPSTRYSPEQRWPGVDGLHFTPEAHRKLGAAIAAQVKEISKLVLCRN
jgi:lysophospholipase L1-like esterase